MYLLTVNPATRKKVLISLSLLAVIALARFGLWAAGDASPVSAEPKALRGVAVDDDRLALTFNISWGEEVPKKVLEILQSRQVKATFFVTGSWAAGHPDLLRNMVAKGHEIGSLGQQHIDLSRYPYEVIREEIDKAKEEIEVVTGIRPTLFRPPDGGLNNTVLQTAAQLGYTVVLWGTDSQDWMTPGPDYIVNRVLARTHPGDIVLLNASDSSRDTPDALSTIVARLHEKGLHPTSVGELLAR